MTLPVTGAALLPLGILFGFIFGWLLQRARLTDTDVIIAQLRLRDYTLFKVMLTAIIVGGVGVFVLHSGGLAAYHIKPANLLAVALGAVLFGVGMAVYGYCPGTGLAAIGTGSLHALAGAVGMLAGAIAFAFSFDWIKAELVADRRRRPGSAAGADRHTGPRLVRRAGRRRPAAIARPGAPQPPPVIAAGQIRSAGDHETKPEIILPLRYFTYCLISMS